MNLDTKRKLYKMAGLDPKQADAMANQEQADKMAAQDKLRKELSAKMQAPISA